MISQYINCYTKKNMNNGQLSALKDINIKYNQELKKKKRLKVVFMVFV